jgi:hypothetical protein
MKHIHLYGFNLISSLIRREEYLLNFVIHTLLEIAQSIIKYSPLFRFLIFAWSQKGKESLSTLQLTLYIPCLFIYFSNKEVCLLLFVVQVVDSMIWSHNIQGKVKAIDEFQVLVLNKSSSSYFDFHRFLIICFSSVFSCLVKLYYCNIGDFLVSAKRKFSRMQLFAFIRLNQKYWVLGQCLNYPIRASVQRVK